MSEPHHNLRAFPGDLTELQGLSRLALLYLDWMREHNYSIKTVCSRHYLLLWFVQWCNERDIGRVDQVTRTILERYQRTLYYQGKKNGQALTIGSQLGRIGAVQAFFGWLVKREYLPANPASDLELPKQGQSLPKDVFTQQEAEAVINNIDTGTTIGLRNRAILEALYSTGIRRQEIIKLAVTDVNYSRGTVLIRYGKGNKERVVPIGERAVAWIEKYLHDSRPVLVREPDHGMLFVTYLGKPFLPSPMSHLVRELINAANIGKSGSCHTFRHTCATLMLEGGADIRFIQQMLGHECLQTTQIYTQVSISALKAVHTATHPAKLHQ